MTYSLPSNRRANLSAGTGEILRQLTVTGAPTVLNPSSMKAWPPVMRADRRDALMSPRCDVISTMRKANPAQRFGAQVGSAKAKPYLLFVKGVRSHHSAFLAFMVIAPLLLTTGRVNAQTHVEHAYRACLEKASAAHDASWAAECKRIAEKDREHHNACISKLKLSKSFCDASYKPRDASPNCRLSGRVASVLNASLQHARRRCRLEKHAASWHSR